MAIVETAPDWGALIEHDRVHGSLYTDPAIYAAELERIWYRTWVYVGHESEVPEPNDYVVKSIGPQPIIMSRDKQGGIHLLLNRCTHRANLVCDAAKGNSERLPLSVPRLDVLEHRQAARLPVQQRLRRHARRRRTSGSAASRASSASTASSSARSRRKARHCSSTSAAPRRPSTVSSRSHRPARSRSTAGWLQHKAKANWKMLLENETDGYHPQFVHASIFSVADSGIGDLYGEKSTAVARDLGRGHTENDLRPEFRRIGQPLGWFGTDPARVPDYVSQLEAAHGADKAREVLIDGAPHTMIFPNLFIAEIQLFVLQPLAVDLTVQHVTAVQFPGVPGHESPAAAADDRVRRPGRLPARRRLRDVRAQPARRSGAARRSGCVLKRGTHRERQDEDGFLIGDATDEVPQRGIWRHYRELMETA